MKPSLRSVAVLIVGAAVVAGGIHAREARASVTGAIQNPANGHWYKFVASASNVSWASCESSAEALGGYLATLTSSAENQWVYTTLMSGKDVAYLGGTDAAVEGTWQWVSGEAWSYTNWYSGMPDNYQGNQDDLTFGGSAYGAAWDDARGGPGGIDTVYNYVIEWDSDPNGPPPPPPPPPQAPINLAASYSASTGVTLTWTDASSTESGFRVERHPAGYVFSLRAETSANVVSYVDSVLYPSATYTYRVAAFNGGGTSAYTNEASVSIPAGVPIPAVPKAPSRLGATEASNGTVDLVWTDNSDDEVRFELDRAAGGAAFATRERVDADVTESTDGALHPGWPYAYRVRALALQGPSPYSSPAGMTLPATLDVAVTAGKLTDSPKLKHDTLKLSATYAFPAANAASTLDPVANGLELQLGAANAPVPVSIGPADAAWKVTTKKTKPVSATWKSAKGVFPKVTIVVDLVKHVLTATVTNADFTAAPTPDARLLVASSGDGGAQSSTWVERKTGVFAFK